MKFDNLYVVADTYAANYIERRELKSLVNAGIDLEKFFVDNSKTLLQNMIKYFGDEECYVAKLSVSVQLRNFIKDLDWIIDTDNKGPDADWTRKPKYVMHSMHDSNLFAILTFLDCTLKPAVKFTNFPVYASNMIFEFRKESNKTKLTSADYNITIEYNDKQLWISTYEEFRNKIYNQLLYLL